MSGLGELVESLTEDVDAAFLFSPSTTYYDTFVERVEVPVVVVASENDVGAEKFVELSIEFTDVAERIRFGIEGGIDRGHINEGAIVLCATKLFDDDIGSVMRVRAGTFTHTGIYDLFTNPHADPSVIRNVLEIAIELGKKGQKGKPVGALFVVGDAEKVMNKSRSLSYNPFEKSHVHVGDPIVDVMLKEFSRLDGAFIISDWGKIVAAFRYLEPAAAGLDIPKGLGARHISGGAITRDTNAIAVALSESDGLVRAFSGGELILELDPQAY